MVVVAVVVGRARGLVSELQPRERVGRGIDPGRARDPQREVSDDGCEEYDRDDVAREPVDVRLPDSHRARAADVVPRELAARA